MSTDSPRVSLDLSRVPGAPVAASARKIAIAMPVEGTPDTAMVHLSTQYAVNRIANAVRMDGMGPCPVNVGTYDVCRARDRYVRAFLYEPEYRDCTDLLHWDEDVRPRDLEVLNRMLASGHDVVGCPYRRKKDPEEYPYRLGQGMPGTARVEVVNGCVQVDWLAFGFMLTSRRALQQMWNAYHHDRWWYDQEERNGKTFMLETVGMFDQIYTDVIPGPDGQPWRTKLSEDYSWCWSYQRIGGKVFMFVGEGSPVDHIGEFVFKGTREGLVGGRPDPAPYDHGPVAGVTTVIPPRSAEDG